MNEEQKPFKVSIHFDITIPYEKIWEFAQAKNVDYFELVENMEIRIPELIDKFIENNTMRFIEEAFYDIK